MIRQPSPMVAPSSPPVIMMYDDDIRTRVSYHLKRAILGALIAFWVWCIFELLR